MQSNAGTIHGLHFSGAPRTVGVKRLRGGAFVHEGITESKEWQAKEKEGKKPELIAVGLQCKWIVSAREGNEWEGVRGVCMCVKRWEGRKRRAGEKRERERLEVNGEISKREG